MRDLNEMVALPSWFACENDGAVSATWCCGEHGAPDSWRVTMLWQPGDGFHVFTSRRTGTVSVKGDEAGPFLRKMLAQMAEEKAIAAKVAAGGPPR